MPSDQTADLDRAAALVAHAEAFLIGAGAGMGVDSGLPDFRGNAGFWRAYPPLQRLNLSFAEAANPRWFREDPALAWGFYGHRRNLYRATAPHRGFAILREWSRRASSGAFVLTSNVDNHFQRAGFPADRIYEFHGSLEHDQCLAGCGVGISEAASDPVALDEATFRAARPWPTCLGCGAMLRPNVLMFGDGAWDPTRSEEQYRRFLAWLGPATATGKVLTIELGAGVAIPTVRDTSEQFLQAGIPLIRINPTDPEVPRGGVAIGLPLGALAALEAIDQRVRGSGSLP